MQDLTPVLFRRILSRRYQYPVVLLALIPPFVGGCGSTRSLPHAALVRKADAVCSRDYAGLAQSLGVEPNALNWDQVVARTEPILRHQRDEVAKLHPGAGDQRKLATLIRSWDATLAELDRLKAASNDSAAFDKEIDRLSSRQASARRAAIELGADACMHFETLGP
jgi:hypothetical protein